MDTTPQNLWQIKADAVSLRDKYLSLVNERVRKLAGNKYRSDWSGPKQLEQYLASYMAFMLPQMVADNPVVQVKPISDPRDTASAEGTQALMNGWIGCKQYKRRVLEPSAFNMLVGWAVTYRGIDLTGQESDQGMPVFCVPLDIGDHFVDPNCFGYERRRLEGHCFDKTKDELLANPKYQAQAALIEQLTPNSQQRKRSGMPAESPSASKTDLITVWQFYIVDTREIITLVENGGGPAELAREEYYGPPDGPYGMWGTYAITGQIYPLPATATWEDQLDDLNEQSRAASTSAKTYKKIGTFLKGQGADGKAVHAARNGQMIGLDNPQGVNELEIGGNSKTQMEMLALYKDRLDRNSGFTDAQRGEATGKATLGENQLAQNNSDARTSYIARRLMDCANEDLSAVGWFFHNSSAVIAKMSIQDQQTGQSRPVEVYGGSFEMAEVESLIAQGLCDPAQIYGVGKDWSDYHLKIELESMQRVADPIRQKRAQDEMLMVMGIVPVIAAAAGPMAALTTINWRRLLRRYGQAFNEPQYDQIIFTEQFSAMVGAMGGNPSAMPGGGVDPTTGLPMQPMLPGAPQGPQPPTGGMAGPVTQQGINANVTQPVMAGVAA